MNNQIKRILILTADAGFGHRSAANAVATALNELYGEACQVEILNPLEDKRTPAFLRETQSDYDRIVREMPELYRVGFDASDKLLPSAILESALIPMLFEPLWDMIETHKPDAILTTFPIYQAPLTAVFSIKRVFTPFFTVITDLSTVHRIWFHRKVEACFVPNEQVYSLGASYGMPYRKMIVTGIPVNPLLAEELRSQNELRASLGLDTDLLTVLAVGSRRVEGLTQILNVFNHYGAPLQLVVIAGKDEELYRELQQIEWHIPAHLYLYTEQMPLFMRAADVIVCKAGGLIVTESLACGLPMMLIDVIPGQETGNAEFVVSNGAGELTKDPINALEALSHWLMNDRALLKQHAQHAQRLGRPYAAYRVARLLWRAAERGISDKTHKRINGRPLLVKLLDQSKIAWRRQIQQTQKR